MRVLLPILFVTTFVICLTGLSLAQQPLPEVTLDQALTLALVSNPALAAGQSASAAADARAYQAGLFPNPELAFEVENFAGQGLFSGFDAAESTASVSQPIPLGGKRRHRRAVAESEHALLVTDLASQRLDVVFQTTAAFYNVLLAQQRTARSDELLGLAESVADTVQLRVDAGKVSPVEATRAGIEVAQARVRLAQAHRELSIARNLLTATWGQAAPEFGRVVGEIPRPAPPPPLEKLLLFLGETPEIARLEEVIRREESAFDLERSRRIPDLQVSVGTRRFEEHDLSTWVASVSVPIPIFDRNQGNRRAAKFEIERAQHQATAARITLKARLAEAHERLRAAAEQTTLVSEEILPSANQAFLTVETGYREGKFGFLDVLDAQRALFQARSLLLDSQQLFLLSRTRLERIIGRPLIFQHPVMTSNPRPARGEQQ